MKKRRRPEKERNRKAPQDDASVRAKSHRHKKVTADKWNQ